MTDIQRYSGKWKIFEKEVFYQGELHIDYENRVIALEIVIEASEENSLPRPPYIGKIPYICGTLFSGAKILLYDCFTGQEHNSIMQCTQQIIYAKYAFWGLSITSIKEIEFSKAIFDFGNIIAWSDLCKYNWEFSKTGESNLIWTRKEPVKFKVKDNLEVTFYPNQGRIGIGHTFKKEIITSQHVLVEFAYSSLVKWEDIMDDAISIQYLIGLGMNQKVEIDSAQYCHSSIYIESSEDDEISQKIYKPVEMIFGTGKVENTQNTEIYDYLYKLNDIKENNTFVKWKENYSLLKPVLDLYFMAFTNIDKAPEMLFLNLMQALETYHARFIIDDAKMYSQRVNSLVDSFCKGSSTTEQWKNFLLDKGQKKNRKSIYLRSRLADLIFAGGELPFWPNGAFPIEYIDKLVSTRNYYTHYNPNNLKKAFTKEELPWVNGHLLALLQYHLLILMEFDSSKVRKRTVKNMKYIDEVYHIRTHTHDIKR